jgi:hypothetical protein
MAAIALSKSAALSAGALVVSVLDIFDDDSVVVTVMLWSSLSPVRRAGPFVRRARAVQVALSASCVSARVLAVRI